VHKFAVQSSCKISVDVLNADMISFICGFLATIHSMSSQHWVMRMQYATASLHEVRCCPTNTSHCWNAIDCFRITRVAHACLSLLWIAGQQDSVFKTELDKHVTAVACNLEGSKDFSAARYGLKRVLALHDIIACLQGSETSADRLADERMDYCGLLQECELGLKLQTGKGPANKAGGL